MEVDDGTRRWMKAYEVDDGFEGKWRWIKVIRANDDETSINGC